MIMHDAVEWLTPNFIRAQALAFYRRPVDFMIPAQRQLQLYIYSCQYPQLCIAIVV